MSKNIVEIYYLKIARQYVSAIGAKNIDFNSDNFKKELFSWLKERKDKGFEYALMLDCMDVNPRYDESVAEVGKGTLDTIFGDFDYPMITRYHDSSLVINGELGIEGTRPILISSNPCDITHFSRFITHNPYGEEDIAGWERLHNGLESNITIGVYGHISDKDKFHKIKSIETLKHKMDGSCKEMYDTYQDNYFYAVASNRKILTLTKTR